MEVNVTSSGTLYYITLDNFLVPMQCTGNSGCSPRGKRAVIVRHYPAFVFLACSVFMCPYHRLWDLLSYDRWIWYLQRANKFRCVPYTRTIFPLGFLFFFTSLHKSWLGGIETQSLTLPHQGIEPRVLFGLPNHWAASPVLHAPWNKVCVKSCQNWGVGTDVANVSVHVQEGSCTRSLHVFIVADEVLFILWCLF